MNRNLSLLISSQVFGFTAANVTVFLSGIIGSQLSTIKSLATFPPSIYVVGIAISTIFASKVMSIIGRRLGFVLASIGSSLACLLAAYSIFINSFIIFSFSCFLLGTGMAFIHQYRFAAAETVEKDKAPKAVSMLLLAGIVSAFIGITLANKTKDLFYKNQNEGIINHSGLIKAWDIDNDGNKELLIEASADWYSSQQGWNSFKLINGKLTRVQIR